MQFKATNIEYPFYAFIFSLNFESMDLLGLGIDFLATKLTLSFLLLVSFTKPFIYYSVNGLKKILLPLAIYFAVFTVVSYLNRNGSYPSFIDTAFVLNILLYMIAINMFRISKDMVLKGLFVFILSSSFIGFLTLIGFQLVEALEGRLTVFGSNANELGIKAGFAILVLVHLLMTERKDIYKSKPLCYVCFALLLSLLLSTGSRTGLLVLILGLFSVFKFSKHWSVAKKGIIVYILILALGFFWIFIFKDSLVVSRLFDTIEKGDLSSRDLIWATIFFIVQENWLYGVGLTGYSLEVSRISAFEGNIASPHNVFLEVLSYTGLIGLGVFLVFYLRHLVFSVKTYFKEKQVLPLLCMIPLMATTLSGQLFHQKFYWVLLAVIVGHYLSLGSQQKEEWEIAETAR